jgi:hypothetical protein
MAHAGGRYRRLLRRPVAAVEAEAHQLIEVERTGDSGGTPFIVVIGVLLFLLPIFLVIVGLAFAAYYLAR